MPDALLWCRNRSHRYNHRLRPRLRGAGFVVDPVVPLHSILKAHKSALHVLARHELQVRGVLGVVLVLVPAEQGQRHVLRSDVGVDEGTPRHNGAPENINPGQTIPRLVPVVHDHRGHHVLPREIDGLQKILLRLLHEGLPLRRRRPLPFRPLVPPERPDGVHQGDVLRPLERLHRLLKDVDERSSEWVVPLDVDAGETGHHRGLGDITSCCELSWAGLDELVQVGLLPSLREQSEVSAAVGAGLLFELGDHAANCLVVDLLELSTAKVLELNWLAPLYEQ
mmetsp:Transcript_49404/g.112116  ORF Transcript_49404/g.112116 Transcript_49404/m.112116 type:complete len:281 (+) Transcript_49404:54-896(+)